MNLQRDQRDWLARLRPRRDGVFAPGWFARMRLQWLAQAIDRVERQLADEFPLLETAPLHRELEALLTERDRLLRRLAQP